jgi:hypothetical protein
MRFHPHAKQAVHVSRPGAARHPHRIFLLGVALSGGILLAPSSASATVTHPFLGSFGGASGPSFTEAEAMAVDQPTGDLLVLDAGKRGAGEGTIGRFHADGTPADFSALATNVIDGKGAGDEVPGGAGLAFTFPEAAQVAVDNSGGPTNGDIYVTQEQAKAVDVFAPTGQFVGQLTESKEGLLHEPCGVAVDPSGNVYVGDFYGKIHKYTPSANPPANGDNTANFPFAQNCALAAGAGPTAGSIFPTHQLPGSCSEDELTKTLHFCVSTLDSATGEEKYKIDVGLDALVTVDPATGRLFTASTLSSEGERFDRSELKEWDASGPTEATPLTPIAPGGEDVNGLGVDGASGDIYIARKANPHIEVWGPAVQLPEAFTEPASHSGATVTLHGVVNAAAGAPVTCVFQYVQGSAAGFEGATSVPCSPGGPFTGSSPVSVSATLSGLPEAGYRYRLVATSEHGSTEGQTLSFETFELLSGLPDGRAYELVSPPKKAGEVIPPEPRGELGVACGDCLPGGNVLEAPMQSAPDGLSVLYMGEPFSSGLSAESNEYLASRAPVGWGTQSLSATTVTGEYEAFSSDLSRGVLAQGGIPLSPEAPTRGGEAFINLYLVQAGVFRPLITREPPNRSPEEWAVGFAGANAGTSSVPAFEHVFFAADDALTEAVPGVAPGAPEVPAASCATVGSSCDLYEWVGGTLRLVNVLPGNAGTASHAVIGSGPLLAVQGFEADVDHAISADGSRVFWTSEDTGQTYVRIDGSRTVEIPGPGTCKQSVPTSERACFLTASADGSKVLLSNGELYASDEAGSAYQPAADLTQGASGFRGILGAGEDLSHVYFVDTAILTGGEQNANGEHAEIGQLNLYAWHEGALRFVGRVVPSDGQIGPKGYGLTTPSPSLRTAQVTLDGEHLAFMSQARLTGYDNSLRAGGSSCNASTEPQPGVPCFEVFEYSAASNALVCASCNPSGERPLGPSTLSLIYPGGSGGLFRQPGNISADGGGRLFFESQDVLSPQDTNGHIQDVYEWEPAGVGSCKRDPGCVYLISSGHSPNDSMFMDSTPSGNDAFFITREQLVKADGNDQLDLYDARVGGGIASGETPPCGGEACRGPLATPPPPPAPASSIFTGPGNFALTLIPPAVEKPKPLTRAQKLALALKACARKPRHRRPPCRAQARKRYGSTAIKATRNSRRRR